MKAFLFIRDIFRKYPFLIIRNILLLLVVGLIEAAAVFALIPVIDFLIKPDLVGASPITEKIVAIMESIGLPVTLGLLLAVFLLFSVMKIGFQIFVQHSILKTKYTVLRNIMVGTFKDFFNARWYFFSSGKQGMLLNTFMREIRVVGDAFGAMARFFSKILETILYLAVPFYLSWQVTSICLATALISTLPFMLLGRVNYRLGKQNTSTANRLGSSIHENISLAKVILGFGNQHKSAGELDNAFSSHSHAAIKSQTLSIAIPLMYYPFGVIVLIIGMLVARKLALPLSEMAVLLYSFLRLAPAVGEIIAQKNLMDNFFPSYEQVINLKNRARQLKQQTGTQMFTGFSQEIVIEGLSFAYPEHEPILVDINVCIPKGKMIAFAGESGAGKSTLIDMIMGFNELAIGRIAVDGVPLESFDINSYRRRIGYVPQDSVLFNMSIRDNLLWAKEGATEDEISEALRQANADEFVERFPERYDTLVGDRGVRLSGGQIQRIALARAILRKPDLLILDEATSALDTYSERLIQQAIEVIARETTVIVIAHRLSTIVNADYVYILKHGRIVEEGIYSELIQMNGYFKGMVEQQALESTKGVLKC